MIRQTALPSGLRIASKQIEAVSSVCVGLWVDTGSRDEPTDQAGISHALEHMLFKGTERRSARQIAEEFDAVGGQLDAYTDREVTAYLAHVLPEDVPLALDVLSDMLRNSRLDAQEWSREQQVLAEEINERADSPDDLLFDALYQACWKDHPLGRPIVGRAEAVQSLRSEDLRARLQSHYTPDRLLVAAAGQVEHEALVELATEHLGGLSTQSPPRESCPAPVHFATAELQRDLLQVHFAVGLPGLNLTDEDRYALHLVDLVLGGSTSSRLFQDIREERGLCYSIGSGLTSYREGGLLFVSGSTSAQHLEEVLGLVRRELNTIAREGITTVELQRAQRQARAAVLLSLDDLGDWVGVIAAGALVYGRYISTEEVLARYQAVTPEDCRQVAERCIGTGQMSCVTVGPVQGAVSPGSA